MDDFNPAPQCKLSPVLCHYASPNTPWCFTKSPTITSHVLDTIVCRGARVLFTLIVFVCVYWCQAHIVLCLSSYCVPYVARFSELPISECLFCITQRLFTVSLDCLFLIVSSVLLNGYLQFLWIVYFWLSLLYYLTFIYGFSGLSISDCLFCIIT